MAVNSTASNKPKSNNPDLKTAAPPRGLALYDRSNPRNVSFMGWTNHEDSFGEKRFLFGLHRQDRRGHLYIGGKSGSGKEDLMEILLRQDIGHGFAVCFIESNGAVIQHLLDFVPESRAETTVLIDPLSDASYAIDPFEEFSAETARDLAYVLTQTLREQMANYWTPQTELLFRQLVMTLVVTPNTSLSDALVLLQNDTAERQEFVDSIPDSALKQFWLQDFIAIAKDHNTDIVLPLLNRLDSFANENRIKRIFDTNRKVVSIEKAIRYRNILLVNLAKSQIGKENSALLGAFMTALVRNAGRKRIIKHPGSLSSDVYVYLDDLGLLAGEPLENMVEEAHKLQFVFTATQSGANNESTAEQVAAVVEHFANMVVFRLESPEASRLRSDFLPTFDTRDLTSLPNKHMYLKLSVMDNVRPPFSAEVLKLMPAPYESSREKILSSQG